MFTYCFNNEFISIFFISLLCILYFYDDERCKMNFPVRDNKVLLYCIVLYCIVLYCIVLYCIVLYCIVLYCIVLYCIVYSNAPTSSAADHSLFSTLGLITEQIYVLK